MQHLQPRTPAGSSQEPLKSMLQLIAASAEWSPWPSAAGSMFIVRMSRQLSLNKLKLVYFPTFACEWKRDSGR